MSSPALGAFNTWVDAQTISAGAKTAVKNRGALLYAGAVNEEAAHIIHHIDAAIADTADPEDLLRLQRLKGLLSLLAIDSQPQLAAEVADILVTPTDVESRWAKMLGTLLMSKTALEASSRFDAILERYDSVVVRNRLKALRDLITAKLGA